MSINPARTTASALPSGIWTSGWVYFTAPVLGMLLAAEIYRAAQGLALVACPKLHHGTKQRCIFCGFTGQTKPAAEPAIEDRIGLLKIPCASAEESLRRTGNGLPPR